MNFISSPEMPCNQWAQSRSKRRNAEQLCLTLADLGVVSGPSHKATDSIFVTAVTPQLPKRKLLVPWEVS